MDRFQRPRDDAANTPSRDGYWFLEETSLRIHDGHAGSFSMWVEVARDRIATIHLCIERDGVPGYATLAAGSYLHKSLMPQIEASLDRAIEWQRERWNWVSSAESQRFHAYLGSQVEVAA